ncbi:hypothetical protein APSETT444_003191 [Aspergillus pseudonomiae]
MVTHHASHDSLQAVTADEPSISKHEVPEQPTAEENEHCAISKGGAPLMRSKEDDLSVWQTVRRYKVISVVAMAAAFSAALDGYQINLNGGLVSNEGFIRQMASPGTTIIEGQYVSAWSGIQSSGQAVGQILLQYATEAFGRKVAFYIIWVVFVVWAMVGATIIIFVIMPETPWWLVSKGKLDRAAKILKTYNGRVEGYDVSEQICGLQEIMSATVAEERRIAERDSQEGTWAVFQGRNFIRFVIAGWPKITQQFVGLAVFFACLATFTTTGASSIGYAYAAEIPQQRLRAQTAGWSLAASNLVALMFSFCTPLMINGPLTKWGVKTGTGTVAVIIAWFILPEVTRRTPAEIDEMFEKKVNLRKFKHYVTDVQTNAFEQHELETHTRTA